MAASARLVAVYYKLVLFAVDNMQTAEDNIGHKSGLAWGTGEVGLAVVVDMGLGQAMVLGIAARDRELEDSIGHSRLVEGPAEQEGIVDIATAAHSIDWGFEVVGPVAGVVAGELED